MTDLYSVDAGSIPAGSSRKQAHGEEVNTPGVDPGIAGSIPAGPAKKKEGDA